MRRATTQRLLALTAVAVLLTVACSGGDKEPQPSPTLDPAIDTTPRPFPRARGERGLMGALLSLEDLGDGWIERPPTTTTTQAESYFCGSKLKSPPLDAFVRFANRQQGHVWLSHAIFRLNDAQEAAAILQNVRNAISGCDEWLSTDGVRRTFWKLERTHTIDIGDEALVVIASARQEGSAARADSGAVFIREGQFVITIDDFTLVDVDEDELIRLAERAHDKFLDNLD
jgi:hypothetical protein